MVAARYTRTAARASPPRGLGGTRRRRSGRIDVTGPARAVVPTRDQDRAAPLESAPKWPLATCKPPKSLLPDNSLAWLGWLGLYLDPLGLTWASLDLTWASLDLTWPHLGLTWPHLGLLARCLEHLQGALHTCKAPCTLARLARLGLQTWLAGLACRLGLQAWLAGLACKLGLHAWLAGLHAWLAGLQVALQCYNPP